MIVGFIITYAVSTYHHLRLSSNPTQAIQHYVIKFVSYMRQVGGILRILWFPPPIKTNRHNITELL